MRKDQMQEKQIRDRNQILKILSNACWKEEEINSLFEREFLVYSEIIMHYKSRQVDLNLQYYAEENKITLSIESATQRLDFLIKFGNQIELILEIIVACQEKISFDNFKIYISQILQLSEALYLVKDDQQFLISK